MRAPRASSSVARVQSTPRSLRPGPAWSVDVREEAGTTAKSSKGGAAAAEVPGALGFRRRVEVAGADRGDRGLDTGAARVPVGGGEDGAGRAVGALEEDVGDLDLARAEALRRGHRVDRALHLVMGSAGARVLAAE